MDRLEEGVVMKGKFTERRVDASGRQIKPPALHVVHKQKNKGRIFLEQTKEEAYYRWMSGKRMMYVAHKIGAATEDVESVCRERSIETWIALRELRRAA
jgi:hypothetical protein